MQHILLLSNYYGMPGVVAALRADDDLSLFGEDVDDLAFAFVAPLGADENRVGHVCVRGASATKMPRR